MDRGSVKNAAEEDPEGFLTLKGNPLVIDEVQKVPSIFDEIKAEIDENRRNGMFFLTGSQNFKLMKNVTESLAGRISIARLLGLSTREINGDENTIPFLPTMDFLKNRSPSFKLENLWERIHKGSFPEIWAQKDIDWEKFYDAYVTTYIDRDIRELSQVGDLRSFRNFIISAAARTGQLLNYADMAKDVGVDQTTIKRWISILEASNIVYLLQPFSMNINKRLVKTPKLYFTDTGLVCYLCKWNTAETLENGAMAGNIFETYVLGEILKSYYNVGKEPPLYFFRTTNKEEVDFVFYENGTLYPLEVKKKSNPNKSDITNFKTLKTFFPTLTIAEGGVLCTGREVLPIEKDVKAIPVEFL